MPCFSVNRENTSSGNRLQHSSMPASRRERIIAQNLRGCTNTISQNGKKSPARYSR
ncbi:hypothetical protein D3C87_2091930 [compost metagenome]